MNYYLKIHILLMILTIIFGLMFSKNRKILFFIIFPGCLIIFSSPFFMLLACFIQKHRERIKELKYDVVYFPEQNIIKNIDQKIKIDNDLIFYTYREKLFPENHALYFLKNLGRKNDIESQIISSSAISHKEEKLLKNIRENAEYYKKEKNIKNLIKLCNSYYNYCYFGYATPNLRKAYVKKSCTLILDFLENREEDYNELYFLLGKLYLSENMYREAEMWFGKLLITDTPNVITLSYLAEIFFYKGEYKKMTDILDWIAEEKDLNEKLKEVVTFWKM